MNERVAERTYALAPVGKRSSSTLDSPVCRIAVARPRREGTAACIACITLMQKRRRNGPLSTSHGDLSLWSGQRPGHEKT